MARFTWGVLCRRALIDRDSNLASYIDCIEGFTVQSFPVVAPPIIVATRWQRESGEHSALEVRVRVDDSNGNSLQEADARIEWKPEVKRSRIHITVGGFEIDSPSQYSMVILVRKGGSWTETWRLPLDVDIRKPTDAVRFRTADNEKPVGKQTRRRKKHSGGTSD